MTFSPQLKLRYDLSISTIESINARELVWNARNIHRDMCGRYALGLVGICMALIRLAVDKHHSGPPQSGDSLKKLACQ